MLPLENHLKGQTSPYLLQHATNPVNWYPWCSEAFDRARAEDKPIFLSIGYSTCHWCHVMAHESFEDEQIAELLNEHFISIKVDKEERPDIDSIYMAVCQAFTGSGGWPTSIFMTPDQKPFFAGTYFPKQTSFGTIGFSELLALIQEKWEAEREELIQSANEIVDIFNQETKPHQQVDVNQIEEAVSLFKRSYDKSFGGFGEAPKFPSPHNLLFLLKYYENSSDVYALDMVENTLTQMYRGGIFDHIGYGFSRYSTDRRFLVPHFEKMLYDNALLILAYCKTFQITKNTLYRDIAAKIGKYILSEMTSPSGGFYSAQDADSDGEEGKYYVFEPDEIVALLGTKTGKEFNELYDITAKGNFEGKNIPNLLVSNGDADSFVGILPIVYEYRKSRNALHLDDKVLTSWNSLMIAAMCWLYRINGKAEYLTAAKSAQQFIANHLSRQDTLFVSYRNGVCNQHGFLDDYAYYIYSLLFLYDCTLDMDYIDLAKRLAQKVITDFYDDNNGGFYLSGKDNETLIVRPKESYDGAMPSGNSIMAFNLVRLTQLTNETAFKPIIEQQFKFLSGEARRYPAGFSMYLIALLDYYSPPQTTVVVTKNIDDIKTSVLTVPLDSIVKLLKEPTDDYKLLNNKTTYYICRNHSCLPPMNELK